MARGAGSHPTVGRQQWRGPQKCGGCRIRARILPTFIVGDAIRRGELVPILRDFPPSEERHTAPTDIVLAECERLSQQYRDAMALKEISDQRCAAKAVELARMSEESALLQRELA